MALGIQALTHKVELLQMHVEQVLSLISAMDERMSQMPTRADFDAAKAALSAEITAVVQAITDLRAQLAAGNPITDQDLADIVGDNTQLLGAVPAPPPPTP